MEAWEETMAIQLDRRNAIRLAAVLTTGALALKSEEAAAVAPFLGEVETRERLTPVEGLSRQHGVLRRIVNVYAETERRIRSGEADIDAAAIADAAKLFRAFGEDWHQRVLEERCVFPAVRRAGGELEKLVEVLLSQHGRGREITDYLIGAGARGGGGAAPMAAALGSMARMVDAHEAFEDTVVFPAWSAMLSKDDLKDTANLFQDMEREAFGKGWFEEAVARVRHVEQALGVADLDAFTAPRPPMA
jgi:hemerythrin-like domain-containing protein